MAHHRNFDIETIIVPDVAGQYEAAFVIREVRKEKHDEKTGKKFEKKGEGASETDEDAPKDSLRYKFPPVGSYLTPDDAREQTEAWARRWIDENFPE